jgi:hypothetical protein
MIYALTALICLAGCANPTAPVATAAEEPQAPAETVPEAAPEPVAEPEPVPAADPMDDPDPVTEPEPVAEPEPAPMPAQPPEPWAPELWPGRIVISDNADAIELDESHDDATLYRTRLRILTQYHIDYLDEAHPERAPFRIWAGGKP